MLADQVRALTHHIQEGIAAAEQNQPELIQAEYQELHTLWGLCEEQLREKEPAAYLELEAAFAALATALRTQPLDPAAVRAA